MAGGFLGYRRVLSILTESSASSFQKRRPSMMSARFIARGGRGSEMSDKDFAILIRRA